MGMPMEAPIVLTDSTATDININEAKLIINNELNVENRVDYQLQKTNIKVQELQKRQNMLGYLPTLNFSAGYNYNAMRKEFNFLSGGQPWFNSYNIGFSLKIPVFDGFQKKYKIAQSKINILKAQENARLTEQSIRVNVSNYEIQYKNAIENISVEKENLDLAQSVYASTQLQYNEGSSSALDLVQAESSLRESQNNYFNKLFSLFTARLDLEQSKGTLMNYINNFK
jgi:outer membrane protein